jgi:NAD(P)-dependent dehydrogenase (short-subunit alcohol dehydrogenase family)
MSKLLKKILLVGGSSAIGQAIATEATKRGHQIISSSSKAIGFSETNQISLDVTDNQSVEDGVQKATSILGGLNAIIYAPAITVDSLIHTSSLSDWQNTFDVNFMGAVRVFKATIKSFLKLNNGVYQFISSTASVHGVHGAAPYACSKAALDAFSRNIAIEYGRFNIRAYSIRPGFVNGGMLGHLDSDQKAKLARGIAMQRFAEVSEIGHFSISTLESSTYLSGTELNIDGGGRS